MKYERFGFIKNNRFHEFFEVNGIFSMRNLTTLIGVVLGGVVVLFLTVMNKLTTEIYSIYMGTITLIYGQGKLQDDKTKRIKMTGANKGELNVNDTDTNTSNTK
jgi:hypothetical protein